MELPYDNTNPVIYDNDSFEDMYTDELILALYTLGRIDLQGMVTTVGGFTDPWIDLASSAAYMNAGRSELVQKAKRSGMKSVDNVVSGAQVELRQPPSRHIEDTAPPSSPGARFIIEQARRATPDKPVVIVTGGPATSIADALLQDPSIADRLVVAWAATPAIAEFNSNAEPFRWASDIVLQRLNVVLFPFTALPRVNKADLVRLPDTELRRYMIDKEVPHVQLPGKTDGDSARVIPLIRSGYARKVVRQRWAGRRKNGTAVLVNDPHGNLWTVTRADREVATEAWWATLTNPQAWSGGTVRAARRPFAELPTIPGQIEAEAFDAGGPDVAYHLRHRKTFSETRDRRVPIFRVLEHVEFDQTEDIGGGHNVAAIEAGEWLMYTVDVRSAGVYVTEARIASPVESGRFTLQIGDQLTSPVEVPSTGGWQNWRTINLGELRLTAGQTTARINVERGDFNLNWIRVNTFTPNRRTAR